MGNIHYKSWSQLNKDLTSRLCVKLQKRITYFATSYKDVHNSYGRAAIRFDGKELACFSWHNMTIQESDVYNKWQETGDWNTEDSSLKEKWDKECIISNYDFLNSAASFLQMKISDALSSDDYIIKVLAIMDSRVGKRTIEKIRVENKYIEYPEWVKQFFELRINQI